MPGISESAKVGEVFVGESKAVTWERLWAFSGGQFKATNWPAKNIHTSPEFAEACGLRNKVAASGTQYQGYVIQLLISLFGKGWLSLGSMDVRFIRIVNCGDTLTSRAVIESKHGTGKAVQYVLRVECVNQVNEAVLVGTATGSVGSQVSAAEREYGPRLAEARAICSRLHGPHSVALAPLEYVVTPEFNQQYLYAEEDFDDRYITGAALESAIVHPALILNWSNDTRSPSYSAAALGSAQPMWATLHTREQTFFCSPAYVGSTLRVTWNPLGSYDRRGRPYSISEIEVVDGRGTCILKRLYYTTVTSRDFAVRA